MKHNIQKKLAVFGISTAMALVLAACDSDQSTETDSGEVDTTQDDSNIDPNVDYSKVVTAGEVRDGVAFGDLIIGNPDAPVTMIEYASMTCPHCASFHRDIFPQIKEEYIKTGKVKLVFRNFVRDQVDLEVAKLTRCVGPDRAFNMVGVYFDRFNQWARPGVDPLAEILGIARQAGINRVEFDACRNNAALERNLIEMRQQGTDDGLSGTPFFIIGDESFSGARPFEEFAEMFDDNM